MIILGLYITMVRSGSSAVLPWIKMAFLHECQLFIYPAGVSRVEKRGDVNSSDVRERHSDVSSRSSQSFKRRVNMGLDWLILIAFI